MKLPDPTTVDPIELADMLRVSADLMIRIDGDRDHMNTSRLTCGQVQGAYRLMLIAAERLYGLQMPSDLSDGLPHHNR
jgi:hypothetical protein